MKVWAAWWEAGVQLGTKKWSWPGFASRMFPVRHGSGQYRTGDGMVKARLVRECIVTVSQEAAG